MGFRSPEVSRFWVENLGIAPAHPLLESRCHERSFLAPQTPRVRRARALHAGWDRLSVVGPERLLRAQQGSVSELQISSLKNRALRHLLLPRRRGCGAEGIADG